MFEAKGWTRDPNYKTLTAMRARFAMSHFVPPTLQKLSEQTRLQTVWQRAAQKLQAAEYIAIVGYSWPANDHFISSSHLAA